VLGVLLVSAAVVLLWRPQPRGPRDAQGRPLLVDPAGTTRLGTFSVPLALVLSFFVGCISSLVGVGGGIIHVPAMVHFLGFPVHAATATSHFILALTALIGMGVHLAQGDWASGLNRILGLSIGVVIGAQVGARLSTRIHGQWILRGLAVALGLVGIRVLVLAFGR
jgi:uncharacterized protein